MCGNSSDDRWTVNNKCESSGTYHNAFTINYNENNIDVTFMDGALIDSAKETMNADEQR